MLELYCGCGGLSFIDRRTDDVIIETKWAVDYEASMCAAFKANYPQAFVSPPAQHLTSYQISTHHSNT